jgi:hypothetical protein
MTFPNSQGCLGFTGFIEISGNRNDSEICPQSGFVGANVTAVNVDRATYCFSLAPQGQAIPIYAVGVNPKDSTANWTIRWFSDSGCLNPDGMEEGSSGAACVSLGQATLSGQIS